MGLLDRFRKQPQQELATGVSSGEASVILNDADVLAGVDASASRSLTVASGPHVKAFVDSLVPVASAAAQDISQRNLAIVKFPKGVDWNDLCVRHEDGWLLLSSKGKDGKFGEMAAIKRAGLQPAAIANLALQGAALVVGQAYMTQISEQYARIESGISDIRRDLDREQKARLKTASDNVRTVVSRYDELVSDKERRERAAAMIGSAMEEAKLAWNYQILAVHEFAHDIGESKRLTGEEIERRELEFAALESKSATAFQLFAIAQQVLMRLDGDFGPRRIEGDRGVADSMTAEFDAARAEALGALLEKIDDLKGVALAIAEADVPDGEAPNPVVGAARTALAEAQRVNVWRMRDAARKKLSDRQADLREGLRCESEVARCAATYEARLDELDFAYNQADVLVMDGDSIRLIATEASGPEPA